jgi:hypothetical protein
MCPELVPSIAARELCGGHRHPEEAAERLPAGCGGIATSEPICSDDRQMRESSIEGGSLEKLETTRLGERTGSTRGSSKLSAELRLPTDR